MKGSEKQVAWANEIKANAISAVATIVRNAEAGVYPHTPLDHVSVEVAKEFERTVIDGLEAIDSAAKIIDIRKRFDFYTLERMAKAETRRRSEQGGHTK